MSTDPGPGQAGREHDQDDVDEDVTGDEPVEREGEYTDSDVGPDDTDPPHGSYVSRDGSP